ncbi:MAG: response regulator [Chromatiaceae bacterium]|nr:MAG: response regulator [Chromatiaceae bacterium]
MIANDTKSVPAPFVLVVDGSPGARYRLRLALRRQRLEVTTVATAEAALALLRTRRPIAIFANRILPGMNALELLEVIGADPNLAGISLIITGSVQGWPLRELALRRGVLALLDSATELVELPVVLAAVLAARDTRPPHDDSPDLRPPRPDLPSGAGSPLGQIVATLASPLGAATGRARQLALHLTIAGAFLLGLFLLGP